MVHISDGVLDPWLWESGWAVTAVILAYTLSKMKTEDVPRLSVITAAVFVSSLVHLSVGPTSVHFILNGFAGVMLGILAYLRVSLSRSSCSASSSGTAGSQRSGSMPSTWACPR